MSDNTPQRVLLQSTYRLHDGLRRAYKVAKIAASASYRRAAQKGAFAAIEHEEMFSQFHFDTILDVGANVGQFAIVALTKAPRAQVYSYEPIQSCFEKLASLRTIFPNLHCAHHALGEIETTANINVAGNLGSSSLLAFTPLQNQVYPGTASVRQERVLIKRLDDCLDPAILHGCVLLKLDVQGFELSVLRGAVNTLERVEYVYLEGNFVTMYETQPLVAELIEFLHHRNFSLRSVYNVGTGAHPTQVQADFLFQRR